MSVYGIIWIAFIEMFFVSIIIIKILLNIIINAKLNLLCQSCIDICKKYSQRRIGIEPSISKNNPNEVSIQISLLCSICYDNNINLLLEPCNHICICDLCYNLLVAKECPICKTNILTTKKVFFIIPNPI